MPRRARELVEGGVSEVRPLDWSDRKLEAKPGQEPADFERGFRIMKDQLDLAPVYHRLPDRIRAHTSSPVVGV